MMARNTTLVLAGALVALTAGAPLAMAQEAIMLETIGAVRMLPPQEARRINDEATRQQQAQPASLPRQHAELAR